MDSNSPFAPQPEEQETNKKETVVENKEGKIVVTLKGGKGYEAPWIVIHADNVADAQRQLDDKALGALIERTKEVATFFNGGTEKQAANAPAGKPQGATQAPGGKTPPEGYEYKSGFKNGRAWHAFMPPKGSGLQPIWLDAQGNPRN